MTDNTNIEADIPAFMAQYRKEHPESEEYSDAKIQYNLDRGWILGWSMARRAALGNAEPLRNKDGEILWEYSHSAGGLVPATEGNNAEPVGYQYTNEKTLHRILDYGTGGLWTPEKGYISAPVFLHPSVPATIINALKEARNIVAYAASGMTHSGDMTNLAKRTLEKVDAALINTGERG